MVEYKLVTEDIYGKRKAYRVKDFQPALDRVKLLTENGVFIEDYTGWPDIIVHLSLFRARVILLEKVNDPQHPK